MNIASLFLRAARRHGARPALALGADVLCSYGELARQGAVVAGQLRGTLGLAPGDRVALVMRNLPDYVLLLLAGWHAGLTMVPVNAKLHPRELAYILDHSGARVCFASADLIDAVAPLAGELAGLRVIEVGSRDRGPAGSAHGRHVPLRRVGSHAFACRREGASRDAMMTYVREGPESLDGILADLDAAWPNTAGQPLPPVAATCAPSDPQALPNGPP